ncbi:MAG: hypothetical protein N4A31_00310 [Rickettsiales bacterium]|jgi:hypothetical protein|nr:hypothetical protein [Rickettsiales bacterium]
MCNDLKNNVSKIALKQANMSSIVGFSCGVAGVFVSKAVGDDFNNGFASGAALGMFGYNLYKRIKGLTLQ